MLFDKIKFAETSSVKEKIKIIRKELSAFKRYVHFGHFSHFELAHLAAVNTDSRIATCLAFSPESHVREALAKNPSIPYHISIYLLGDNIKGVKERILINSNLEEVDFVDMVERFDTKSSRLDLTAYTEIFNKKAGGTYSVYWHGSQAECISTNKNAPMSAIKKFDVIRFSFLRADVKAEVKVLKKTNRDRAVNKHATPSNSFTSSEELKSFFLNQCDAFVAGETDNESKSEIYSRVNSNNLSEHDFRELLGTSDKVLLEKLLLNPNIPLDLFEKFFFTHPHICAKNVNFNFLLAEKPHLLGKMSRQEIKKLIAVEDTSPALITWAYDGYFKAEDRSFSIWKGLLQTIATHKNTPPELLIKLSRHQRPEIKKLATSNPSCPVIEKIVPVILPGGQIARVYEEALAEEVNCRVSPKIENDFGHQINDPTFLKDDIIQAVNFVPFTARTRRVELRIKFPAAWGIEEMPAMSLNLWDRFKLLNENIVVELGDDRTLYIEKS